MIRPLLILALILGGVEVGQAQSQPRVAIDTLAAAILADFWTATSKTGWPTQQTFCLYGSGEVYAGVPGVEITSAVKADGPCAGASLVGIAGFVNGDDYEAADVTAKLGRLLGARSDLMMLAEVHAITRVFDGTAWRLSPLVWAAVRPAVPHSTTQRET